MFEAVRIPLERPRFSVCVSSQVGCALGCRFCETGRIGFERNLEPWEIVEQVLTVRRESPERPLTGVVFQGQGEPLHNYEAVIQAARILRDPCGPRIGSDRITISTVGLLPQIERYTDEGHPYRLILSLTSAFSEKRARLVPITARYGVPELAAAMRRHAARRGGPVSIGWVLIAGFNSGDEEADELGRLFAGVPVRISVIDVNDPSGAHLRASDEEREPLPHGALAERPRLRAPLLGRHRHPRRVRHARLARRRRQRPRAARPGARVNARTLPGDDPGAIALAAAILLRGGLVAFPTETVYGLGANAFDARAVARIFEVKARPAFDPLIVHLADAAALARVAEPDDPRIRALAERFWPGPLTLVLPRRAELPEIVSAGLDTVGVRVPAHPVAHALLVAAGTPVAAPSANPFGYVSPTTAAHVAERLGDDVDLVLDGGPCRVGVESTILSLVGTPLILRPGGVPKEELEAGAGAHARRGAADRAAGRPWPAAPALRDAHAAADPPGAGGGTAPGRAPDRAARLRSTELRRRATPPWRCSRRTARSPPPPRTCSPPCAVSTRSASTWYSPSPAPKQASATRSWTACDGPQPPPSSPRRVPGPGSSEG